MFKRFFKKKVTMEDLEKFAEMNRLKSFDFNDLVNIYKSYSLSPYNINVQKLLKQIPENPFISSAIDKMQQGFYNVGWSVFAGDKKERKETTESIVYKSLLNPNVMMDTNDFLYYCFLYWTIYGEFVIQKQKLIGKYDLWVYSPNEYNIEYYDNLLLGIKAIEIGGKRYTGKELDNFTYKRLPNLYTKRYGLNRVISLALLHDYYCLISRWNNSILKNSGKRQFLILLDQLSTGETVEKIQDKIMENSGADGIGKPTILTGFDENSKIQILDYAPSEFDYMSALTEIRNITSNVLNVPDLLVGGKDNAKYNNMREAKQSLYTENILPACKQIKSALMRLFQKDLKYNETIDFLTDDIEVLRDNQIELMNALNSSKMHTVNEKRDKLNLEKLPNGDVILVGSGDVSLEEALSEEVEPINDDESVDDI